MVLGKNSICDPIFYLTSIINNNFQRKLCTNALFLEIIKPFDCVTHTVLLNIVSYYGFNENV